MHTCGARLASCRSLPPIPPNPPRCDMSASRAAVACPSTSSAARLLALIALRSRSSASDARDEAQRCSRMSSCTELSSWLRSVAALMAARDLANSCCRSCRISRWRCSLCIAVAVPPGASTASRDMASFTSPRSASSRSISCMRGACEPPPPPSRRLSCTSLLSSSDSSRRARDRVGSADVAMKGEAITKSGAVLFSSWERFCPAHADCARRRTSGRRGAAVIAPTEELSVAAPSAGRALRPTVIPARGLAHPAAGRAAGTAGAASERDAASQ